MLDYIKTNLAKVGLSIRGVITDNELFDDALLIIIGSYGDQYFRYFQRSEELKDGQPNPLDRWSHRIISDLATYYKRYGAVALGPNDSPSERLASLSISTKSIPNYWPFQHWAMRAETVYPSPLGILIHPKYGLWHTYRGALLLTNSPALANCHERPISHSPCDSCINRPCLQGCPVKAFKPHQQPSYDTSVCFQHLKQQGQQGRCFTSSCQARTACPIGADYRYKADSSQFLMNAFYNAEAKRQD